MMTDTFQSVELESKEGKTFLRRVIRDCDWTTRASASTDWRIELHRTIKGKTGEPDTCVVVRTDAKVGLPGKVGMVQSFHDSTPVHVVAPRYVHLSGSDTAVLAKLLLDGSRITAHASSGSSHSSRLGLSIYSLEATVSGCAYGAVTIGGETIAKDGETLICGAVSIN